MSCKFCTVQRDEDRPVSFYDHWSDDGYCHKELYLISGNIVAEIFDGEYSECFSKTTYVTSGVNYCPMCGRELAECEKVNIN